MTKSPRQLSSLGKNIYASLAEHINESLERPLDTPLTKSINDIILPVAQQLAACAHLTEILISNSCCRALQSAGIKTTMRNRLKILPQIDQAITALDEALIHAHQRSKPALKSAIAMAKMLDDIHTKLTFSYSPGS